MQEKISRFRQKNDGTFINKLIKTAVIYVLSFLFAGVGISGVSLNAAAALMISCVFYDGVYLFCIPALILANYIHGGVVSAINAGICALGIILVYTLFRQLSAVKAAGVTFAVNIIASFSVAKLLYLPDGYILEGIIASAGGAFLTMAFMPCVVIFSSAQTKRLTGTERLCIMIFLSFVSVSLSSVKIPYTDVCVIFAFVVTMFLGKYFPKECMPYAFMVFVFSYVFLSGAKEYGVVLMTVGFFSLLGAGYPPAFSAMFRIVGVISVCVLMSVFVGEYLWEMIISEMLYFISVKVYGNKLSGSESLDIKEKNFVDESMALVLSGEIALQKNALRSIISGIDTRSETEDIYKSVCRDCIGRVCMDCENYHKCWFDRSEETYSAFKYYIKLAQEDLTGSFFGCECTDRQAEEIKDCVNYSLMGIKSRQQYKKQINGFLNIYTSQINYLCDVMDRISSTVTKNLGFYDELSAEVYSCLNTNSIEISDVLINSDFDGRLKSVIKSDLPLSEHTLRRDIPDVLKGCTGKRFRYSFFRQSVSDNSCMYAYEEDYDITLKVSFAKIAKDGEDRCGDNILAEDMGRLQLIAISDGMGSGEAAWERSEKVTNMLYRLIAAGYEYENAVEFINSVLIFGSNSEIFTTLDMLLFDRSTSEGIFFKAGAESAYIKRGEEFIKIKSETLPVGILDHTLGHAVKIPLKKGDYIYLMSDGLISSFGYEEQALASMIQSLNYRSTQKIADEIISIATSLTSGIAKDDMSVIVCKVR